MGNCFGKDKGDDEEIQMEERQEHPPRALSPPLRPPPCPAPPVPAPSPQKPIVIAMYDFNPRGPTELMFKKGEKLEILTQDGQDWWRARHMRTQEEGYVPVPYIAAVTSLDSQDWYFGKISREEAESLLIAECNKSGAFLVRQSDSNNYNHKFTLSAKVSSVSNQGKKVKHYRIYINENGYFFVTKSEIFMTLNDLVEYYMDSDSTNGMSYHIRVACKRPTPTINDLCYDKNWEISPDTLTWGTKIGSGSFGEVWRGTWNNTVDVAIKTLKKGTMTREEFLDEASIMKKLRHKHILALHAVCSMGDPILIITELMEKGSLLDFLREQHKHDIEITYKIYMATQVASGMAYLEESQLIHRDLAARNVLVGESYLCKISDFGLARLLQGDEYTMSNNAKFPVKWTAPEAFTRNLFSIKSDVWSFGILCMEIITNGAIPYPGMSKMDVMEGVQNGYRMSKPIGCPDSIYELMYACWHMDMDCRPTFEYIYDCLYNLCVYEERSYE